MSPVPLLRSAPGDDGSDGGIRSNGGGSGGSEGGGLGEDEVVN